MNKSKSPKLIRWQVQLSNKLFTDFCAQILQKKVAFIWGGSLVNNLLFVNNLRDKKLCQGKT